MQAINRLPATVVADEVCAACSDVQVRYARAIFIRQPASARYPHDSKGREVTDESEPPAVSGPLPSGDPDTPEGAGEGAGTIIAFPSRPRTGAAGHSSSDIAGREASAHSGYDVDNAPVLADAGTVLADAGTVLADAGKVLAGGALLIADAEADDGDGDDARPVDWAWVEEWRAGHEPVPWASGLGLAGFSALVVGVAVWVLSAGLAGTPVLAVGVNLLVAGGLAPAMWLSRGLPVLRWIALGSAIGVLAGWVCALAMLPLPTP